MTSPLIKKIIHLISNIMEGYTVALFTPVDNVLRLDYYVSFSKEVDKKCSVGEGEGLINWIFREQKAVVVNNFHTKTTTLKLYKNHENIKSFIGVPLPELGGVLCVDSKKNYIFTENKEKIIKELAIILEENISFQKKYNIVNQKNKYLKFINIIDINIIENKIIGNKEKIINLIKIIKNHFDYKYIIFAVSNNYIIFNYEIYDYSNSDNSLINLIINNNINIFSKHSKNKELNIYNNYKSNNFVGIPFYIHSLKERACIGIVKKNEPWHSLEKECMENLAARLAFI